MNFLRRLFLSIGGLSIIALGILVVACVANETVINFWLRNLEALFKGGGSNAIPLLIAAALMVLGALSFFFGIHYRRPERLVKVNNNEEGTVNISLNAVETMVKKAAAKISAVKETKARLKAAPEGVAIYLHVVVTPEANIPETAAALQKEVKESLENMSGLKVLEVKVLVESIDQNAAKKVRGDGI